MSKAVQSNTTPSAGPLKPSPRHVVLTSPGKAGLPDILPMLKNNSPFARTDNVASSHLMTSEKVISSQGKLNDLFGLEISCVFIVGIL